MRRPRLRRPRLRRPRLRRPRLRPLLLVLSFTFAAHPQLAWSQEPGLEDALALSRGDLLARQRQFEQALQELGKVSKTLQEDALFLRKVEYSLASLYRGKYHRIPSGLRIPSANRFLQKSRVTRRKTDADRNSDQNFDERGWQFNQRLEADLETLRGVRGRFVVDLEGFRNGHEDLRYRTLLADFYRGSSPFEEGIGHLALGDSASFASPFFMRGSRVRGLNLLFHQPTYDFHAVAGAYPFWLEERDAYIYPRTVMGIRNRWRLFEDRFRLGTHLIQSRDSEKIRTIDVANQPRDNVVMSLDQEVKLIPEVWFLKAVQAYSYTDDNLLQDRFGDTAKLKDTAFTVESIAVLPKVRSRSRFVRTGPDFRILTDIASGGVLNAKSITADRLQIEQLLDFDPWGPLDFDFEASHFRNNLDNDDSIGHYRQNWYTANLGLKTPEGWPYPRIRQSWVDTVSSPGTTTRPSQVRTLETDLEIYHRIEKIAYTLFADYLFEEPLKDEVSFDDEWRWSAGVRASRPFGKRLTLSSRYRYETFDEVFDEVREDGDRQEVNASSALRLWSNASLSFGYTFLTGRLINPGASRLTQAEAHIGYAGFHWPYRWLSWDKKRKLTITPGLNFQLSEYTDDLEERPIATGSVKLAYEKFPDWKVELGGEFRYDDDDDRPDVRTEESRLFALFTSRWN